MMASLGNFETHGGNSETHNFGTHEMTKSKMSQNPRFLSTHDPTRLTPMGKIIGV